MHVVYKALLPEEVERIVAYCNGHTVRDGGLFEVYLGSDGQTKMIVVNSCSETEPMENFRPLGAFYCNYLGPGIISLEEEEPTHEGMPSTKDHLKAIKQVIDMLIQYGHPGMEIRFKDLEVK